MQTNSIDLTISAPCFCKRGSVTANRACFAGTLSTSNIVCLFFSYPSYESQDPWKLLDHEWIISTNEYHYFQIFSIDDLLNAEP